MKLKRGRKVESAQLSHYSCSLITSPLLISLEKWAGYQATILVQGFLGIQEPNWIGLAKFYSLPQFEKASLKKTFYMLNEEIFDKALKL